MIETVEIRTDDVDGRTRANVETVRFMLDGEHYELELGQINRRRLTDTLAPYIEHARRPDRNGTKPAGTRPDRARRNGHHPAPRAVRTASNEEIRQWALAEGYTVKPRGRISANIVDMYHGAHSS